MVLQHISQEDIHNITSGQVIIELSSVIKELLENSLDAHAGTISITFKRFGLDGLEVTDNGDGMEKEDFEQLCLKNYTSKLESFESLVDVKTLGFRGEALNSICNVSDMVITTATAKEAPKGSELTFDKFGKLINQKIVNQSKGTTVKISNIFKDLPVRKLNLEKHYRREFQHCLNVLTPYLLILNNVRFVISNIDATGKKKIVMKTGGNRLVKDNLINVYGSSGLQGIEAIDFSLDLDDTYSIHLNGLVSGASIGNGRLTKDRQFIYINKRPVQFKRANKLINHIYKKFNYLQNPVFVIDFEINENLLDINVTPDKSTILLSNKYENLLMDKLESILENHWDNQGTYKIPIDESSTEKIQHRNSSLAQPKLESFALFQEDAEVNDIQSYDEVEIVQRSSIRNSRVSSQQTEADSDNILEVQVDDDTQVVSICETESITETKCPLTSSICQSNDSMGLEENIIKSQLKTPKTISAKILENHELGCYHTPTRDDPLVENDCHTDTDLISDEPLENITILTSSVKDDKVEEGANLLNTDLLVSNSQPLFVTEELDEVEKEHSNHKTIGTEAISIVKHRIRVLENDVSFKFNKRRNISKTRAATHTVKTCDFADRTASEALLGLSIHKNDFINMDIVGQFNKGFIIVHKKDTDDILIVDQHASDEKYNFEQLNEKTVFKNQPLVVQQKLDLSSVERLTILNNLNAFERNGFKFKTAVKEEGEDTGQEELYLTSLPYSKNTIFNLSDLNELIQLVQDRSSTANAVPRPSKVRSMFAMRACRSSIMIGQSLSRSRMENIVQNLSTLDKPWNCPHGRPTMRHIVKIDQWSPFEDDYL